MDAILGAASRHTIHNNLQRFQHLCVTANQASCLSSFHVKKNLVVWLLKSFDLPFESHQLEQLSKNGFWRFTHRHTPIFPCAYAV